MLHETSRNHAIAREPLHNEQDLRTSKRLRAPFAAQFRFALGTAMLLVVGHSATAQQGAAELGLASTQPTEGRFVKVDRGFMVAYTETLPGSNTTFRMLPIPGSTFLMGSPENEPNRKQDEGPQIEVTIAPFWMAQHEVSWKEYKKFMGLYNILKNQKSPPQIDEDNRVDAYTVPTPLYEPDFTFALGEESNQPAVTMSQYAAKQYTKWISMEHERFYRLPTEAEWEYACRSNSQTAFSFGNDPETLDEHAWYFDNSEDEYHPVGTKAANAWGLHDMHGNVAEMVLDQYQPEGYADFPVTASTPVVWPTKMFGRVIRGGAWDSDPEDLRSAARSSTKDWRTEDPNLPKSPWWFTDEQALTVGFRIIRPLDAPVKEKRGQFWDADVEYLQQDVESRLAEGRGVMGIGLPAEKTAAP